MTVVKNLMVRAGADFSELQKELKKAQKFMKTAGKEITAIGKSMTSAFTLPAIGLGAAAFKMSSDLEEAMNKTNVAFGDNAGEVTAWSKTTLKEFGIAQSSALDMASLFGDMSTSMGMSTTDASAMSKSLVGLAGDLASFKNIGISEAETALKSIFTGETESLKNLGIVMTQANLNAYALAQGMNKTVQEMTQAEQVQLRYAYVMDMTKNAQGDFARTSDGAANQMRIFTESLKEAGASFGNVLLPIITPVIQKINEAIQVFAGLDDETKKNIVTAVALVAAIGPVLLIIGKLTTGIGAAIGVFKTVTVAIQGGAGFMGALSALLGPAGLVLLAIAAVVAIGVLLYKNWDTIKEKAGVLYEGLKNIFGNIKTTIISVWDGIVSGIKGSVNKIISVMNKLIGGMNKLKFSIPDWVPGIGGKSWGMNIPNIPMLAEGGIVDRPTLAMIGEAGPEAVVPLDKLNNMTGVSEFTVNLPVILEGKVITQIISRIQFDKSSGKARALGVTT